MKDILIKAQEEIDMFERPSKATSVELMGEVFELRGQRTTLNYRVSDLKLAINQMQSLIDGEAWNIAEAALHN